MPKDRADAARSERLPRARSRAPRRQVDRRRSTAPGPYPSPSCPRPSLRYDGPPPPRVWAERDPVAAARLSKARAASWRSSPSSVNTPVENLMTPDYVRRLLWEPPDVSSSLESDVTERLTELGARQWQIDLTLDLLTDAIRNPAASGGVSARVTLATSPTRLARDLLGRPVVELVDVRRGHLLGGLPERRVRRVRVALQAVEEDEPVARAHPGDREGVRSDDVDVGGHHSRRS